MKRFYKVFVVAAILIASATFSANAQFYYGIKAGANVSTVGASDSLKELGDIKNDYGYQAGIVVGASIPIIGIGIEAEGLWVNNKMSFSKGGDIVSNSIEVPVMAAIPILPIIPITIKVGPSFMLYNDAHEILADGTKKELDQVKSSVGYTIGLGLKISKITLDVRFNGQFKSSDVYGLQNTTSKYDVRANNFSASLGYRF